MKAKHSIGTKRALAMTGVVALGVAASASTAQATIGPGTQWVSIGQVRGPGDALLPPDGSPAHAAAWIGAKVTAVYRTGGFNGYYMQSGDSTVQTPGVASQGVFVPSATAPVGITAGDSWVWGPSGIHIANGTVQADQGPATVPPTSAYGSHGTPPTAVDLPVLPADDTSRLSYDGMMVHPTGTFTVSSTSNLSTLGQVTLTDNSGVSIILDDGSSWNLATDPEAAGSGKPYTQLVTGATVHFTGPVILARRGGVWMLEPMGQVTDTGSSFLTASATTPTPAATSVKSTQDCSNLHFTVANPQAGDQLRVTGVWDGASKTVTVPATEAGWSLVSNPTWQKATAVVLRKGKVVTGAKVSVVQQSTCVVKIVAKKNCTSITFSVPVHQPGDLLKVDGHWSGQAQTTTVSLDSNSVWWSGSKPSWTDATAVVIRGGRELSKNRVSITRPASCPAV